MYLFIEGESQVDRIAGLDNLSIPENEADPSFSRQRHGK